LDQEKKLDQVDCMICSKTIQIKSLLVHTYDCFRIKKKNEQLRFGDHEGEDEATCKLCLKTVLATNKCMTLHALQSSCKARFDLIYCAACCERHNPSMNCQRYYRGISKSRKLKMNLEQELKAMQRRRCVVCNKNAMKDHICFWRESMSDQNKKNLLLAKSMEAIEWGVSYASVDEGDEGIIKQREKKRLFKQQLYEQINANFEKAIAAKRIKAMTIISNIQLTRVPRKGQNLAGYLKNQALILFESLRLSRREEKPKDLLALEQKSKCSKLCWQKCKNLVGDDTTLDSAIETSVIHSSILGSSES
jgi:hypothetical protein